MNDVMNLQQYSSAYRKQAPHDKVDEPSAIRWPIESILPLILGLIGVNILSVSHTAPVLANSVPTPYFWVKVLVGTAGFFGVEFLMFSANFVARSKTGGWQRNLAIVLAMSVAIVANVGSVVGAISIQNDTVSLLSGVLIGVFAPVANFVTAEMLRKVIDATREDRIKAIAEYKQALIVYDAQMRQRFIGYLKKKGIVDQTEIMRLSNGESLNTQTEVLPQSIVERKPVIKDGSSVTNVAYPPRIIDLAAKIAENDDGALSYSALQAKYKVGPADISKVKRYMQQ